ncbi:hypothetical protein FHX48_001242 [Microbacterium halimionae]|uniref:Uncharacterized protein n=1 Tax=Microbacterium halimionae TaxID=1526413 RepID=A0A7W3JNS7_9MICO|nr:hypothetical protein [Microbacterium halimionae]NII96371.1 hypothetical protein [Microbacterium halimionae]
MTRNPNAYASCNPINSKDPSGLVGCLAQAWDVIDNTAGFMIGAATVVGAIWAVPSCIGWNQGLYESGKVNEEGYSLCELEWDPRWPNV